MKFAGSFRKFVNLAAVAGGLLIALTGAALAQSEKIDTSQISIGASEMLIDPSTRKWLYPTFARGQDRIVNPFPAIAGAYPFQVAVLRTANATGEILKDGNEPNFLQCGGSMIGAEWVLTAAHCVTFSDTGGVFPPRLLNVYVGSQNFQGGDRIEVQEIFRHEDYNAKYQDNDITLLRLKRPPKAGTKYSRIRMVTAENEAGFTSPGVPMKIIGWGYPESGKHEIQRTLQEQTVWPVDREKCFVDIARIKIRWAVNYLREGLRLSDDKLKEFVDRIGVYTGPIVNDTMICAGVPNSPTVQKLVADTCQGDSGGPLLAKAPDDNWTQVGIVSWGIGCGIPNLASVYTRLGKYSGWVSSKMK